MDIPSVYERLGGAEAVCKLVRRFYQLMDQRPDVADVRRLHQQDMANSEDKLYKFLSGWFGGPPLYMQERGHPRLRMRHPFRIGPAERDQWLLCMRQALDEQVRDAALRAAVVCAFEGMAEHLVMPNERLRGPGCGRLAPCAGRRNLWRPGASL